MTGRVGKPSAAPGGACAATSETTLNGRRGRGLRVPWLAAVLVTIGGCRSAPTAPTISLQELKTAPVQPLADRQRHVVSDRDALRPLCQPLGRRVGLVQVRDVREWEQLARAVPQLGSCPDLALGIVVGLLSEGGIPLEDDWPFEWQALRLRDGAGLIEAHFNGGNYLPDDTVLIETAYVPNLKAVLAVSVDGTWYFPP